MPMWLAIAIWIFWVWNAYSIFCTWYNMKRFNKDIMTIMRGNYARLNWIGYLHNILFVLFTIFWFSYILFGGNSA